MSLTPTGRNYGFSGFVQRVSGIANSKYMSVTTFVRLRQFPGSTREFGAQVWCTSSHEHAADGAKQDAARGNMPTSTARGAATASGISDCRYDF